MSEPKSTIQLAAGEPPNPATELLKLSLPIIGMTISRMLMGFIDFVMVSQLGTEAQAAISPCTTLVFAIGCLGMGIAQAVQTFVAQVAGRGEPRQAGSYAWQSLYIAFATLLITVPFALTVEAWYGWIASLGKHPAEMLALEIEYTRIALWWIPLGVLSMGFDGFFMGIQRPRTTLIAVVASLVVNAVGNYVLIFGKFGFPELGMTGAAIATVIGWAVRAGILTVAILTPEINRRYNTRRTLGWDRAKIQDLLRIGTPTSFQWLVDIGAWLVFLAVIVPSLGMASVAASNIGIQFIHVSFMPAIGVGIALCSQVGQAIGAGKPEEAVMRTRIAMRLTGTYMTAIGFVFLIAGRQLIGLLSDDPAVIRAGQWVLIGAAIFQVFDAMCITYTNSLRGAGDTRWPAIAFAVCCWVIFIGGGKLITVLLPDLGVIGPWIMCTVYIVVLGLLLRHRWKAGPWREIRLFDHQPAAGALEADAAEPALGTTSE